MAAEAEEPKKPQNAYWIFLSGAREGLAKECGSAKGTVVGKLAGERWKAMTPEQKKPFEEKAGELKKKYEQALEEYKKGGGVPGKRRLEKKEAKKDKETKRGKKTKDSTKPKKPQSSFWLWLADNRAAIMTEVGKRDGPSVAKHAGEKWKKVSDATKAPYEKRAQAAKEEHAKAMAEWKKTQEAAGSGGDDDEDEEDGSAEN